MVQALPKSTAAALKPLSEYPDATLDFFSSDIPTLDLILGGGYPRGRLIEVFGPQSTGKTTLALQACIQAQKHGKVAFLDAEHKLAREYAAAVGVKVSDLLFARPKSAAETLQIAWDAARAGFALIVIDSIAAMPTQAELDGEMGDTYNSDALHERAISDGLKRISQELGGKSQSTILVTNQLRENHGVVFGSPEVATGGKALGYYTSVRLDLRSIMTLKRGHDEHGIRVKFKVAKNKAAAPFQITEADLLFGYGFSYIHNLFDLGMEAGVINRVSQNYCFRKTPLGRGRDAALDTLKGDRKLVKALEGEIAQWLKTDRL
jgi:recombination protein RecA